MAESELYAPSKFTKQRDQSESRLHFAVVDYLKGEIRDGRNVLRLQMPFPGLLFSHFANEIADKTEAFWASRKGILKGAPDLILWERVNGRSQSMAIELKSKTGAQSPDQKEFQRKFEDKGGLYAICRSVAEVRDRLIAWGLACKNMQVIEPRLSHNELLAMQAEIYKPQGAPL